LKYVLPSSDSNPQLHILANRLPPKIWAIVNQFILAYPGLQKNLLLEWSQTPPTWIVYFPALIAVKLPSSAQPIIDFVYSQYTPPKTSLIFPFMATLSSTVIIHKQQFTPGYSG